METRGLDLDRVSMSPRFGHHDRGRRYNPAVGPLGGLPLKEIRTIITEGRIEKKTKKIYTKPLSSYSSEAFRGTLQAVDAQVGIMLGVLNASRSGSGYCLNMRAKQKIDDAKREVRVKIGDCWLVVDPNRNC